MADERLRTKRELKRLFTNLKRKGISDDMISILIDTLWRDRANLRTSGFFHAGAYDAQFSFNVVTRKFTIIPFDPLVEDFEPRYSIFSWSNLAVHHRIFTPLEIIIPDQEGLFCIYFDKEPDPGRNQILAFKKNPTQHDLEIIYTSKVLISFLYWDAANSEIIHFGNDKHGSEWNPHLHWFVHTTQGAKRKSGLQFTGYILNGDGSSNDHAKFNITGGVMLHDDFEMPIPTSSNTIPVLYSFGTYPRFLANNGYAFAGSGRVYFNSGQISLVQADTNNFVLYHIFATNEILTPSRIIISVMGTAQYTTLADAYQGVTPELDGIYSYMPQQGRYYLGTIIIQTSDDYTNDVKARIVALTGNESHLPVTIAPGSEPYLFINEKQQLAIDVDALPGGEVSAYDWNIHGPEQVIGNLPEPDNLTVTVDGTGAVDETIPAGTYAIVALNAAGETLPVNVPEIVILVDTTYVTVNFDTIQGATGYRVYNVSTGDYADLLSSSWFYNITTPETPGTLPVANTAYITQTPCTIDNGDTVEVVGEGIDVETEVDELDSTIKRILVKKQRSDWNATEGKNVIDNKPAIPAAQIQSDYTQANTEALDFIKNKPDVPAAQIQSDYTQTNTEALDFIKNKPVIPGTQIQSDYTQANTEALDFIKNKPAEFDLDVSDGTNIGTVANSDTLTVTGSGSIGVVFNAANKTFTISAFGGEYITIPNYYVVNLTEFLSAYADIRAHYNGGNIYINGVIILTANLTLDLTGINFYGTSSFAVIMFCNGTSQAFPVYRIIITAGSPSFYNIIFAGSTTSPYNDLADWTTRYIFEVQNVTHGRIVFDNCTFDDIIGGTDNSVIKYTGAATPNCAFQLYFKHCTVFSHTNGITEADRFDYAGLTVSFTNANTRLWVYVSNQIADQGSSIGDYSWADPLNNSSTKFNLKATTQPAYVLFYSDESAWLNTIEVSNLERFNSINSIQELDAIGVGDYILVHDESDKGNIKKYNILDIGNGENAYVYIAYASAADGTDFTLTFSEPLNYIAILSTYTQIISPAVGDFAGLWKNYKGITGSIGPTGIGVPAGGTANQKLRKISNIDNDTEWADDFLKATGAEINTATDDVKYVTAKSIADSTIVKGDITPAKLGAEFKTSQAVASTDIDWATGIRFTKTIAANTTLTFSNIHVGTKFLEITGDFAITLPTGFTYAGGTRAASGVTLIQVVCTTTTSPVGWYVLLKAE